MGVHTVGEPDRISLTIFLLIVSVIYILLLLSKSNCVGLLNLSDTPVGAYIVFILPSFVTVRKQLFSLSNIYSIPL